MSPTSESESGALAGQASVEPSSAAAPIDDPNAVYALGSSTGESARLKRQAEELLPEWVIHLTQVAEEPTLETSARVEPRAGTDARAAAHSARTTSPQPLPSLNLIQMDNPPAR